MGTLYDSGKTKMVRTGTVKLSIAAPAGNMAGNSATMENPEDEIILINRVVAEIRTAAEAASLLLVGIGDNASDNVENCPGMLLNTNALNIGTSAPGIAAGVNCNCRMAAKGAAANAFILVGVDVPANADSLVADVYVDYIIP
jgi:DNA-binding transcriptional regulator LsrR (DeoR family)